MNNIGEFEEKKSKYGIAVHYIAGLSHLYTLKIFPNNTFFISGDNKVLWSLFDS